MTAYRFATLSLIFCTVFSLALMIMAVLSLLDVGPWHTVPMADILRDSFPGNYASI